VKASAASPAVERTIGEESSDSVRHSDSHHDQAAHNNIVSLKHAATYVIYVTSSACHIYTRGHCQRRLRRHHSNQQRCTRCTAAHTTTAAPKDMTTLCRYNICRMYQLRKVRLVQISSMTLTQLVNSSTATQRLDRPNAQIAAANLVCMFSRCVATQRGNRAFVVQRALSDASQSLDHDITVASQHDDTAC